MKTRFVWTCCLVIAAANASKKVERNALPREIFRDDVEPKRGGKVPEAARDPERIELNKKDAVGLNRDTEQADAPNDIFDSNPFDTVGFFKSPFDNEDYGVSDFSSFDPIKLSESGGSDNYAVEEPAYTNPYAVMYDSLFNKPKKTKKVKPVEKKKDTYKYVDIQESPPRTQYSNYNSPPPYNPPSYDYNSGYDFYSPPKDDYYSPQDDFYSPPSPEVYSPPKDEYYSPPKPTYEPEPYYPPKPLGPVLLEKRPYEVKSVQPLPITVSESYTSFDCRDKYPGRHYADPEAGCQVYHYCHHDGKQDTFECGYGTVFNEYIGTCDYRNNVHCTAGQGYAAPPKPHHDQYSPPPYNAPHDQYSPQPQGPSFESQNDFIQPFSNFGPF